jgi:hypothetical protein
MIAEFIQPPRHTARVSTGLLILRVVVGLAFVQYGFMKMHAPTSWAGPGLPAFVQLFAFVVEFFGGLMLVFGALTPVPARFRSTRYLRRTGVKRTSNSVSKVRSHGSVIVRPLSR